MPLVLERSSPPVVGKGNQNWSIDAHRLQIGNLGAMNAWGSGVACGRGGLGRGTRSRGGFSEELSVMNAETWSPRGN